MTTVTAWLSVSATNKRTLYLGADSQGTSLQNDQAVSMREQKLYASDCIPEIFSLSADLRWGQSLLRQILTEIGRDSIRSFLGSKERAEEFTKLPSANPYLAPICELEILYGVRGDAKMSAGFRMYRLQHAGLVNSTWSVNQIGESELNSPTSAHVLSSGKGGCANTNRQKWIAGGDQGNVARTFSWSLCDLVNGIPSTNFMTGGHPQLVKLDQRGFGQAVGVKFNGVHTVYGRRTTDPQSFAKFWVDENFTALNATTLERYSKARRYGRSKSGR